MSWNLLIYHPDPVTGAPLPLGSPAEVTALLDATFSGLRWRSPQDCELSVDGGFSISLTVEVGGVSDLYTRGGYNHLREFAGLCRQHGWHIMDAQEGEELDLDDPYSTYDTDQT